MTEDAMAAAVPKTRFTSRSVAYQVTGKRRADYRRELGMVLEYRAAVTVGEIVSRGNDVTGVCVHMAERIAKQAAPGQILVSRGVTVLMTESTFEWLGTRSFKGVPADRSVFELS